MIRSSLEESPFRHIRHNISGALTRTDIALAIEHALQHVDVPILWDLRQVDLPERPGYEDELLALIDEKRLQMPTRRRAFVVNPEHSALAQGLLRSLRIAGEWSVFPARDESGALRWLGGG